MRSLQRRKQSSEHNKFLSKKREKKENGAHNHRSHRKFRSAQNIHVMLSYANINKKKKSKRNHNGYWNTIAYWIKDFLDKRHHLLKKEDKKNGAHNHLITSWVMECIKIFTSCCLMQIEQQINTKNIKRVDKFGS